MSQSSLLARRSLPNLPQDQLRFFCVAQGKGPGAPIRDRSDTPSPRRTAGCSISLSLGEAMPVAAGADGCKAGWLCIVRDLATASIISRVHASAESLLGQDPRPSILAVDIPIGLAQIGHRTCDQRARRILGKRGCCVFSAPIRGMLSATNQAEASALRWAAEGKRVSAQAAAILPKVREIDAVLNRDPGLQSWVREVHPEVCFTEWNAGTPIIERKKSAMGKAKRAALVSEHFGHSALSSIRARHSRREVADDDIADAFAALWSAERILSGSAQVLPATPEYDQRGLRMEICY